MISEIFTFSDGHDGSSNPNHRGGTDGVDGLSFVKSIIWHQPRGARLQVRVSKDRPRAGSGGGKSSDAAARILTSQMTKATSAKELVDILDGVVDDPIFNKIHASAAYHSLATKWKGGLTPSDKKSPVLPRLAARVQTMTEKGQVEPRTVANVLYSLGKLSNGWDISKGLLMALVKSLGEKAGGMNEQELSNSLLAFVPLKRVAPEVLTALPKLAAQISIKAKDMKPQELSNSLWASARLKDVAPDVKEIVPALLTQINVKAKDMIPQHLSKSLWAATRLKDDAPEVLQMVPALVKEIPFNQADFSSRQIRYCLEALVLLWDSVPFIRISKGLLMALVKSLGEKAGGMNEQELSNSLLAFVPLKRVAPEVLTALPKLAAQISIKAKDMKPQELSNSLWASARLKDVAPDVKEIVPLIVAQIQDKPKNMNPQALSNNLWAAARLKDDAPEVLQMVPALVKEIPRNQADFSSRQIRYCLEALVLLWDSVPFIRISKGLLMALVKSLGEKAGGMNEQELSNSLLAFVPLKRVAPEVLTALPKLAAQISIKAKDMKPQELSNSLWASARLKDVAPDVKEIVPLIVAQIQDKPKNMNPQALSNNLWAAARLKDDAPEVLQMVPALVKEIPRNQADFSSRQIRYCLEALVLLWDSVPEVGNVLRAPRDSKNDFVGFAAWHFIAFLPTLKRKSLQFDIPVVVWACASVMFYGEESQLLFSSVADRLKSRRVLKTLPDWGLCAMLWSFNCLCKGLFIGATLDSERFRRGLSDSDVSESASGYFEWKRRNRAKG